MTVHIRRTWHTRDGQMEMLAQLWHLQLTRLSPWRKNNFWPTGRISSVSFSCWVKSWKNNNCEVHHASGNAYLLIVMKAVQSANSSNTVLVGDDTDLLILLCHHASIESHDLFLYPEPKKTTKQPHIWNIKVTKQSLGPDICQHIFFLYAVLGCDTTYRLHRIGKGASLKKFQASHSFRQHAKVLLTHSASKHDVTCTWEKALVVLYNGNSIDSLDSLRHQRFC